MEVIILRCRFLRLRLLFNLYFIIYVFGVEDAFPHHALFDHLLTFVYAHGATERTMNNVDVGPDFHASLRQLCWIKFLLPRLLAPFTILRMMMADHFCNHLGCLVPPSVRPLLIQSCQLLLSGVHVPIHFTIPYRLLAEAGRFAGGV